MISWFTLLLSFVLTGAAYAYFNRNYGYWKKKGVPFIKPKPFFGSIFEVALGRAHPGEYIGSFYKKFNSPYFGFFAFNKPYLVLKDPEIIKTVLVKDFSNFANRYFVCNSDIDPVASNGLFAIKNPAWKWLRTKLSPYLSYGKIKMMLPLIKDCNTYLVDHISQNLGKDIEVKEMCAKYTTDAIVTSTFGIFSNSFEKTDGFRSAGKKLLNQSFSTSLKVFSYYYAPLLVKLFKFKLIHESSVAFLREVFKNTFAERQKLEQKNQRQDLIDILIEMKNRDDKCDGFTLDENNLIAQGVTFFSAGFETTASPLAFTLHELAVHPEIQENLREEIKSTITQSEELDLNTMQNMKYLNMVLSESMRKYPVTSFIHRECIEDYKVESTGLVIEKGTPIIVGLYGLHFDEEYFPEPHKFIPERFQDENVNKLTSASYLPFGRGPRSCIGQMLGLVMIKMAIIEILRNFTIETSSRTKEPVQLLKFPIIQPKGGLPLQFKRLSERF